MITFLRFTLTAPIAIVGLALFLMCCLIASLVEACQFDSPRGF